MGVFSLENIAIKGITCCVPKKTENNKDLSIFSIEEIDKFIKTTGIAQRRIAPNNIYSSDLCFEAAKNLIKNLNWNKNEIGILIFVSQTPDYILPNTSTILQNKLELPQTCLAFDITLGCSGYVYGISVISSMMKALGITKGLLLAGDTVSKIVSKKDKSTLPLFGDAGSATAFELNTNINKMFFDLGSDGSGFDSIIIPAGGARNKTNSEALISKKIDDGIERNLCDLVLDGMDVFSFGISQVPKTVNNLLNHFKIEKENIDFFVFHQANLMMNKMIAKKLKLAEEKVPYSLENFGNTSCASIPLTIANNLKNKILNKKTSLLLCGFGVGLSWGTIFIESCKLENIELIEL